MADSVPSRLRLTVIGAGLGSAPHFQSQDDLATVARVHWVYGRSAERLAVMLQHRLGEAALGLKSLLDAGELGALVSASASVRWWRPQHYYDESGRGTLARDGGGVLITQAIHTLDLLLCLTGMPQQVTGLASTSPVHRMECEDTAAALLHYANGAIGTMLATTAAFPGSAEHIELNGTLGTASLEAGQLQVTLTNGKNLVIGAPQASGGGANPMAFDHAAHREVLKDFIHAVTHGIAPAITGQSALGVQTVIEAIITSSRSGASVLLSPADDPASQRFSGSKGGVCLP